MLVKAGAVLELIWGTATVGTPAVVGAVPVLPLDQTRVKSSELEKPPASVAVSLTT